MSTATLERPPAQAATDDLLEDPAGLDQWLASLPAQAVCGRAHSSGHCPLAQYLKEQRPQAFVTVGSQHYHLGGLQRHTLPRWAMHFVCWVDSHESRQAITAGAARTALEAL